MTTSPLASAMDRSAFHLRSSSTQNNWGGDETSTLSVLNSALPMRVEWREGIGARWDIWVFDETSGVEIGDFMLLDVDDLALIVTRVARYTNLSGDFHHFEIVTEEHEHSVADLKTAAGI